MLQIVLVLLTALSTPVSTPQFVTDGAGGPDAYGYRWIDNDTTGPTNVPTYRWLDISTIGTRVSGLGDDNVVGPFPIGFNFPYYWYRVNNFYIGSNGYIAFGDNQLAASPFTNLPNPARPNNVLAPLLSDLEFASFGLGDTAKCYYWTNTASDTCVISYINVRFWNSAPIAQRCTFQIVLSKPDSSVTFQYKRIGGAPYNGWGPTANTTGIENILGTVGLSYLNGVLPAQNTLHETLAVRFYPPQTTSYQVYDVGILNALNENSGGVFFYTNFPRTLWAKIKNSGNQPISSCTVFCRVRNASNAVVYTDTIITSAMASGQVDSITFTPDWTPTATDVYRSVFRTRIGNDMFVGNDSVIIETRVVSYPSELMYDDGTNDYAWSWAGGGGGIGNKFIPPRYPCRITTAKANLSATTAATCTLLVYAADGPGGMPGTVLGRGNISVTSTTPAWYQITLDQTINSGAFFVGVTSSPPAAISFICDTSSPHSYQGWEYTGVWAPHRDQATYDVEMRAMVNLAGIEELLPIGISTPRIELKVYPNPFANNTKIQFTNRISPFGIVEIYNAVGEKVTKLTTSEEFIIWNGTDHSGRKTSPGVYFVKLRAEDAPIIKILKLY